MKGPLTHHPPSMKIIHISPSRRPTTLLSLNPSPSPSPATLLPPLAPLALGPADHTPGTESPEAAPKTFAITSVAWAPSCGRSYHLVATGARDGHVRIWRVRPPVPSEESEDVESAEPADVASARWTAAIVGDFDDHKAAVDRKSTRLNSSHSGESRMPSSA